MISLVEALINGILVGGVYGLAALGLAFTWKVINLPNSAQAVFAILGAYISYWLFVLYGISPFFFIIPMGILFMLGMLIRRFFLFRFKTSPAMMIFLACYVLAMVMENLMVMFWGTEEKSILLSYTSIQISGVNIPPIRAIAFLICLMAFFLFDLVLKRTFIGKAMRAVGENSDAAALMGINTEFISDIVAGIGASLAGIAGPLIGVMYAFHPALQTLWIGKMFAIVMLGGLESIYATLIAGISLGILEAFIGLFLPLLVSHIISYILLLLALLIRFRR